jgi:hypothetical protein
MLAKKTHEKPCLYWQQRISYFGLKPPTWPKLVVSTLSSCDIGHYQSSSARAKDLRQLYSVAISKVKLDNLERLLADQAERDFHTGRLHIHHLHPVYSLFRSIVLLNAPQTPSKKQSHQCLILRAGWLNWLFLHRWALFWKWRQFLYPRGRQSLEGSRAPVPGFNQISLKYPTHR